MQRKLKSSVLRIEHLTNETFILSVHNPGIDFQPGQYMILNLPGERESREYSIYNKAGEDSLQFLIREIEDGYLSAKLHDLEVGSEIELEGPFGFFTIPKSNSVKQKYFFISTGTGISPMHSILKSHQKLNYTLIHGVRFPEEKYDYRDYKNNYHACISGKESTDFYGRVTDYLKNVQLPEDALFYLSGNSAMINDVTDYLLSQRITFNKINTDNTEVYF